MRVILALALVLALGLTPSTPSLATTMQSVAFFSQSDGHCTAWSARAGQWVSAAHCVKSGTDWKISGEAVELIKLDKKMDLVLLRGPIVMPLEIAETDAPLGEQINLIGWPARYYAKKPLVLTGFVAAVGIETNEIDTGLEIYHDLNIDHEGGGPGMSGGPIVYRGKVVGVIEAYQELPSVIMIGPTVKDLRKFLELK